MNRRPLATLISAITLCLASIAACGDDSGSGTGGASENGRGIAGAAGGTIPTGALGAQSGSTGGAKPAEGTGGSSTGSATQGGDAGGVRSLGGASGASNGATGGDVAGGMGGEGTGGSGGALTGGTGGAVNGENGGAASGGTAGVVSGGGGGGDITGGTGGAVSGGNGSVVSGGTGGDISGGTGGDISGGTGGDISGGTGGAVSGGVTDITGPCDIYADDSAPCVAAYSMVRRLSSTYSGPLYQVRSESNLENMGYGGTTHDIGQTADGFADKAAQDAVCSDTLCTVSLLYDQSGHGNDLPAAKRDPPHFGGGVIPEDSFESLADAGPLTVGGHDVYSLYTDERQGYGTPSDTIGDGMPLNQEPQGIYMLADGTHYGMACCWDFGNVTPDAGAYSMTNTLFFGVAYWGTGAGDGPWFMADFEAGVWAGGTLEGDPGWGALGSTAPPNENNPSLPVPFALGFLKTDETHWALRMADLQTATEVTTAYEGGLPKLVDNRGAVVLGVSAHNDNSSWGTFFEGAILAGWPSDDAELAVMQNIQAVGYGQ